LMTPAPGSLNSGNFFPSFSHKSRDDSGGSTLIPTRRTPAASKSALCSANSRSCPVQNGHQ
jgi:hypothetical protein